MSCRINCDICGKSVDAKNPTIDELVYATVRNSGYGPHHRIDICRDCFDELQKIIREKNKVK